MARQEIHRTIAYVISSYNAQHSGVYKKIMDQVEFWKSSGYVVSLFVVTDSSSASFWKKIDENALILFDTHFFTKVRNRLKIIKLALESKPSLIYLRDNFPIRIPKSDIPVVIEIQSLVGQELRQRSLVKFYLFRFLKKFMYSKVAGAVYVTRELMEVNELCLNSNIPKISIGNSINLERIDPLGHRDGNSRGLFFVGSPSQPWHGVSELIDFAKDYPEIEVHIVGESQAEMPENVFFYGKLTQSEYRDIAKKCIAGVGSLNLSVNRMIEASPLKVREYLALGLPVILKYRDPDFDSKSTFVLQLPADGRPLKDFGKEINAFLVKWESLRVPRGEISNLDVANKEKIRLEFLEQF
jgi:glycosyltransferase involved in cell wall biosynthesis